MRCRGVRLRRPPTRSAAVVCPLTSRHSGRARRPPRPLLPPRPRAAFEHTRCSWSSELRTNHGTLAMVQEFYFLGVGYKGSPVLRVKVTWVWPTAFCPSQLYSFRASLGCHTGFYGKFLSEVPHVPEPLCQTHQILGIKEEQAIFLLFQGAPYVLADSLLALVPCCLLKPIGGPV
ncbi:unnamed protein product [Leptosia nina]|uniref:Uncharacterized protein n=1 Tax=Leptosia nina TaxID=320188 RepID=A0AAV1ITD7_9NEOP